jgi:hypothetical protein
MALPIRERRYGDGSAKQQWNHIQKQGNKRQLSGTHKHYKKNRYSNDRQCSKTVHPDIRFHYLLLKARWVDVCASQCIETLQTPSKARTKRK